jgi:hypothetical protein
VGDDIISIEDEFEGDARSMDEAFDDGCCGCGILAGSLCVNICCNCIFFVLIEFDRHAC